MLKIRLKIATKQKYILDVKISPKLLQNALKLQKLFLEWTPKRVFYMGYVKKWNLYENYNNGEICVF